MQRFGLLGAVIWSWGVFAGAVPQAGENNLTWEFARERRQQIQSVNYDLTLELQSGSEKFRGESTATITLTPAARKNKKPLRFDSFRQSIEQISINGQSLKAFSARAGSVEIPYSSFAALANSPLIVKVRYVGEFSKEGNGFQRVVDREDRSEYLYTDFEPFQAHELFPCFDQPDLKSVYHLTVKAPKNWKVIGNEGIADEKVEGEIKTVTFAPTPPLSPYLFFVGAGDFKEWTDTFTGKFGEKRQEVPLALYARKSLAKYVDAEAIFELTKKGLQFYGGYFGTPYPFSKYGQIFVPEFNWGGMENPGAVTLNERNIFRGPVPDSRKSHRAGLLLHEMAHMWFGDLVTMEWWNDLWLNESFATYAAALAQDRALGIASTWQDFFGTKTWGYWQDQLVTTHPIETKVKDVRTAKGNFDGITYAKGAASLKQLHYFVGDAGFASGLQSYFSKFAFKNAVRADFIGEIAAKSGIQLDDWTKTWLQSAGSNRVTAKWKCQGEKISEFAIEQTKNVSGKLSPHRTRVGLFRMNGGKAPTKFREESVTYAKAVTPVPGLVGEACPHFVFPNLGDQDFALFALDPESLRHVSEVLTTSDDPLLRVMVWSLLGQMVRDQLISPQQLVETAIKVLQTETTDSVLAIVLGRHSLLLAPYQQYLTAAHRRQMAPALEAMLWRRLVESKSKASLQMTFFDAFVRMAETPIGTQKLVDLLKGDGNSPTVQQLQGFALDQEKRWEILKRISANGHEESSALMESELKRDKSDTGAQAAFEAAVAAPNLESKKKHWALLINPENLPKEIPRSFAESAAWSFHHANTPELSRAFAKDYFRSVANRDWKKSDTWVELTLSALFPGAICSAELLQQSESALGAARHLTDLARRTWRESNDELKRCVLIRKKWETGTR